MNPARRFRALAVALSLGVTSLLAGTVHAETAHVVGRGQTLFWIAKRYRTTPEAIRAANGLREGQLLKPGMSLTIPQAAGKSGESAKSSSKGKGKEAEKSAKSSGKNTKADAKEAGKDLKNASKKGKNARDAKDDKAKKTEAPAGNYAARPKKPGFVKMVRGGEKYDGQVLSRGQLNRASLPGLTKILRHVASDSKKAVDPRLAYLIGLVSDHFGGRTIHVVSGYRPFSKKQYTPHSNHNLGKAMDFAVEGVPNTVVRDYCRTLRDAGVGYYPNSTFVHLDVRTGKAYWIDYSRPGEPPKYQKGGKGKVDESAGDVESNDDAGSQGTQSSAKEPADSNAVNTDSAVSKPATKQKGGLKTPTPAKSNSPTSAPGKSDDPYP
ncbi:MAG: DUF882 domain-containing protein [Polyangiaceae bacterium]|nr:DUF882 domain-containing protein [Polyangiaceae bacterium]